MRKQTKPYRTIRDLLPVRKPTPLTGDQFLNSVALEIGEPVERWNLAIWQLVGRSLAESVARECFDSGLKDFQRGLGPQKRKEKALLRREAIAGAMRMFIESRQDARGWTRKKWVKHFCTEPRVLPGEQKRASEANREWKVGVNKRLGGISLSTFEKLVSEALALLRRRAGTPRRRKHR